MADKPEDMTGGTALIRISAALEAEASCRQDLATALANERTLLRTMIDLIPAFIYAKDVGSRFIAMNAALARNMGTDSDDGDRQDGFRFLPARSRAEVLCRRAGAAQVRHRHHRSRRTRLRPGHRQPRTVVTSKVPLRDENGMMIGIIGIGFDITERKLAEQRLAQGEHLESIGRLAAGVAHEINTPIQYLNDSVYFIREAMQDLLAHNAKLAAMLPVPPEADEDIEDLKKELPPALDRVVDGLGRIAEIVRSMKEFSHVDQREMVAC